jgi:hypothetical protein
VPLENLADRAKAYGISSYSVDGNDVVAVYTSAKEAVDRARNGEGPILIEVKTFRRLGHAQHDPAEYVPKEMRAYWEARDPILLYEKFLTSEKLLDEKSKKELEEKIEKLLSAERDFAENSPMPPAEFAEQGVYCTGDDCHKVAPKWQRPIAEVTPPKSSVAAVWTVQGFGSGKSSGGASAPIHFGDTLKLEEKTESATDKKSKDTEVPEAAAETIEAAAVNPAKVAAKVPSKSAAKIPAKILVKAPVNPRAKNKPAPKKSAKPAVVPAKSAARKARR